MRLLKGSVPSEGRVRYGPEGHPGSPVVHRCWAGVPGRVGVVPPGLGCPVSAAMILARLRKMTDDQLCRWVTARRGCYSGAESKALEAFLLELPFSGRALPAHLFTSREAKP